MRLLLLASLGLVFPPISNAVADIYSYTDSDGIVHFTNVKPRKNRQRWKRISRDNRSIGKPVANRGKCPRCDKVPARDRSPDRYQRYDAYIFEAAKLYQIPVPLIRAVIKVESDYDPRVVSSMGARGLMQLMPAAAKDMGVEKVHEPRQNILGGTRYLRVLANKFAGDLSLTIAGYHAGPGTIDKYRSVPPYANTRKYLRMVLRHYHRYREQALQSN